MRGSRQAASALERARRRLELGRRRGGRAGTAATATAIDDRREHRDASTCTASGTPSGRAAAPDPGAGHRAEAETRVQPGHERAVRAALDVRALDVHRDVPDAHAQPDEHHARSPASGTEPGQQADRRCREAEPDGTRAGEHRAAAPEPLHDRPGQRQPRHRTDRHAQQQQAELRRRQAERVAQRRRPRDERGEHQAVRRRRPRPRRCGRAGPRRRPAGRSCRTLPVESIRCATVRGSAAGPQPDTVASCRTPRRRSRGRPHPAPPVAAAGGRLAVHGVARLRRQPAGRPRRPGTGSSPPPPSSATPARTRSPRRCAAAAAG